MAKTVDFSSGKEIRDFGLSGRTGKFKGDESGRRVLIAQDYSKNVGGRPELPGIVGVIIFNEDGSLSTMPEVPLVCIKLDSQVK